MSKRLSRKNHFLSQMYLDAWKDLNNKIFVYNILVPDNNYPIWQKKTPKSVCKYDSMFVRIKNGEEIDDIEKWFSIQYEMPAKEPLMHAINDNKMTVEEWKTLINLMMCHFVRSPKFIIKILEIAKSEDIKNIFEEQCEKISDISENKSNAIKKEEYLLDMFPLKITDEGFKDDNTKELKIETVLGKQFYLWAMKYFLVKITKELYKFKWGIITVDDNVVIPTTDNPVVSMNFNSIEDYNLDVKLGEKNSIILFPISPKRILYTCVGKKNKSRISIDYEQSILLKKLIIKNAYRKVVSSCEDSEVKKTIPRIVNKELFYNEKEMWAYFQKQYIEKESAYIR